MLGDRFWVGLGAWLGQDFSTPVVGGSTKAARRLWEWLESLADMFRHLNGSSVVPSTRAETRRAISPISQPTAPKGNCSVGIKWGLFYVMSKSAVREKSLIKNYDVFRGRFFCIFLQEFCSPRSASRSAQGERPQNLSLLRALPLKR